VDKISSLELAGQMVLLCPLSLQSTSLLNLYYSDPGYRLSLFNESEVPVNVYCHNQGAILYRTGPFPLLTPSVKFDFE